MPLNDNNPNQLDLNKIKKVLDYSPTPTCIYNNLYTIVYVNHAFEKLWNARSSDVIDIYNVKDDPQAKETGLFEAIKEAEKDDDVHQIQITYDPRNSNFEGRKRIVELSINSIFDDDNRIEFILVTFSDITEQFEQQAQMQQLERTFHKILEQSPIAVAIFDKSLVCTFVNKAFEDLWQFERTYIIGKFNLQSIQSIDPVGFNHIILSGKDTEIHEYETFFSPSKLNFDAGRDRRVKVRVYSTKDDDGEVENYYLMYQDITEIFESREKLEEKERIYFEVLDQSPMPITIYDENYIMRFANKAFEELWVVDRNDILGVYDISKDIQTIELGIYDAIKKSALDNKIHKVDYIYNPADSNFPGRVRHTIARVYSIKDSRGKVMSYHITQEDITEVTEQKKKLAKMEEDYIRILKTAKNVLISIIDIDGKLIFTSDAIKTIMGYEVEELLDISDIFEIIHPNDVAKTQYYLKISIEDKTEVSFDYMARHINGEYRNLLNHISPIFDEEGNITSILIVTTDVTSKYKIEEEKIKAQKFQSLSLLVAGIAHDFNNILTSILGNANILQLALDYDKDAVDCLKDIMNSVIKGRNLTKQFMTFTKGVKPQKNVDNIIHLIQEAISLVMHGRKSTCKLLVSENISNVEIDPVQITQVLHNLIINADQSMKSGGEIIICVSEVEMYTNNPYSLIPGNYVKIEVIDHGEGIAEAAKSRIFEPYYSTKTSGHGLGLAISYSIIKKHDGHLTFVSTEGKGSSFIIYLPASTLEIASKDGSTIDSKKLSGKVLLMDDDPMILNSTTAMLQYMGIKVEVTSNGIEAIETFKNSIEKNSNFDLVILDYTIPGGFGGTDTIRELIRIDPDVNVILSTGHATIEGSDDVAVLGFKDILFKPYTYEELYNKISKYLSKINNNIN